MNMKGENKINCRSGNYGNIKMTVIRKDGTVKSTHNQPMHSYVENFWRHLHIVRLRYGSVNLPRVDGSGNTNFSITGNFLTTADPGTLNGIVVGSGNAPFNITQTQLDSLIPHGALTGELEYGNSQTIHSGDDLFITKDRTFINNSGSSITVREIGVCVMTNTTSTGVLLIRDVLDTPIELLTGEVLHIHFKFGFVDGGRNWRTYFNRFLSTGSISNYIFNSTGGRSTLFTSTPYLRSVSVTNNYAGLMIGSGTTAATYTDHTLETPIFHGTDEGMVTASQTTVSDMTVDDSLGFIEFDVIRSFTNVGSTNITVNEIAHMSGGSATYPNSSTQLLHRIVLAEPVIISPNSTKTVIYKFRYDVGV